MRTFYRERAIIKYITKRDWLMSDRSHVLVSRRYFCLHKPVGHLVMIYVFMPFYLIALLNVRYWEQILFRPIIKEPEKMYFDNNLHTPFPF